MKDRDYYIQSNNTFKNNCALDVLRTIGIIMVVLVHYGQTFGDLNITRFGEMGCQLFFFASGYGCSISYNRTKSIFGFYKKRIKSIVPAFYTALLIVVLLNILSFRFFNRPIIGVGNTSPVSVLCNFAMIHGFLPFCINNVFPGGWYIGTAVIIYLFHPILCKLIKEKENRVFRSVFIVLLFVFISILLKETNTFTWNTSNDGFYYFFFTNQISSYILGIVAYYYDLESKRIKCSLVLSIVFLTLTLVVYYSNIPFGFAIKALSMGLFSFFFYNTIKRENCKTTKITTIGKDSFYYYLTHVVVVRIFASFLRSFLLKLGIESVAIQFFVVLIPCILLLYVIAMVFKKIVTIENRLFEKR